MIEVQYKGEKKEFGAEEISAMVLTKMKTVAEALLLMLSRLSPCLHTSTTPNVKQPRCWNRANHNVLRIINEPTAAIAYGLDRKVARRTS